ncbi:MAG: hypothetical protein IT546_06535, partial [Caulobacteraceae bacterium]|nr:hypothetical protein [Caulobacteraceae bacterium]
MPASVSDGRLAANLARGPLGGYILAMRTETPQPIRLADYRPPAFLIDEVKLDFNLEPGATRVKAELQ